MKNKKGFTLIELLAVIVILGVLLSVSVVAVNSIRKKQQEENKLNTISSILTGAKKYVTDNNHILNNDLSSISISVEDLVNQNYVDFDSKEENFTGNVKIASCGDKDDLKLLYYYEYNGTIYNDCGCETQVMEENAIKLCSGNSCDTDENDITTCEPIEQKN